MSAVPPLKKNPHHGHAAAVTSRKSRKPLLLIAPSTDIVSPATPAPNFSNVLALSVGFPDLRAMCLASCVGTGAMSWRPPSWKLAGCSRSMSPPIPAVRDITAGRRASAEPDTNGDGDRDHAERGEPEVHGCREPDPFLIADAGRGEDRHQGAVRRREELAQPRPVLVGEHRDLTRQAEQVRERDQDREGEHG